MNKVRILLVDDHAIMRDGTRLILTQQPNFEVVAEANDGIEALELFPKVKPDLIVFDISMPNLNGVELAKAIFKQFPKTKLLALTAHNDTVYLRALLKYGITGFISKSASGRELVEAVQAVIAGQMVFLANSEPANKCNSIRFMESRLEELSARELEVLQHLLQGERNTQIAESLTISLKTLETHIRNIYNKLEIESRSELLLNVEKWNILLSGVM